MKYDLLKLLMVISKQSLYALVILCAGHTLLLAEKTNGQSIYDVHISLSVDNVSIEQALHKIEEKSKFTFAYGDDVKEIRKKLDLNYEDTSVADILKGISRNSGIEFRQINGTISAKLKESSVEILDQEPQKEEEISENVDQRVTGTVKDVEGQPLPGVSILIVGTTIGTVTDIDGNYSLVVPDGKAVLSFSFIGYVTEEVLVGNQTSIDMVLTDDIQQLSEIVVVGYTEKDKRKLTSSIATVRADQIENVPIASFDNILQGTAPGLLVQSGSGQPGSSANVVLRGVKKFNTQPDSAPLFLIDGAELSEEDFASINPNDIESVSVLKDAAATQIYGSRGARGVIVITTKRGKKGKTQIQYNTQFGFSAKPSSSDASLTGLTSAQLIDLQHELGVGPAPGLSGSEVDSLKQINTDWLDVLTRRGKIQSHEVRMSGANEKTDFYVSAGYYRQEGIVLNSLLDRYSTRLNINHQEGDFKMGVNLYVAHTDNKANFDFGRATAGNPFYGSTSLPPYDRAIDPVTGEFALPLRIVSTTAPNPLERLTRHIDDTGNNRLNATVNFNYSVPFLKGLSLRSRWSLGYSNSKRLRVIPADALVSITRGTTGQASEALAINRNLIGTNSIHYDFTVADNHFFSVAAYQEFVERNSESTSARGRGLLERFENLGGATNQFIADSEERESALTSLFATIDYSYANKYNATLGVRRDGSSNFGSNNQFANFYSIGLGWILSEEGFMSSMNFVNFAKLRTSYGTTGNSNADPRDTRQIFTQSDGYGGQKGLESRLFNPDLKWETTQKLDIGLDLKLFNDFLTLGVDYYSEKTVDFLLNNKLSLTNGFGEQDRNSGSIRNRGVELSLEANTVNVGDFNWTTSFNMATNTTTVLTLPEGLPIILNPFKFEEGKELGRYYFVRSAGVNPANGNRLYYTPEGELTETYDEENGRVDTDRRSPKYFGGLTNTFSYKGLQLRVLFTYAQGHVIRNTPRIAFEDASNVAFGNVSTDALRFWSQPGDITDIPRIGGDFERYTTNFLEDASYVKLRNVHLGYNLPNSILEKVKVSSLQIYVQGQNLYTFTKFSGTDPENSLSEYSGSYPGLSTYTVGLDIKF